MRLHFSLTSLTSLLLRLVAVSGADGYHYKGNTSAPWQQASIVLNKCAAHSPSS